LPNDKTAKTDNRPSINEQRRIQEQAMSETFTEYAERILKLAKQPLPEYTFDLSLGKQELPHYKDLPKVKLQKFNEKYLYDSKFFDKNTREKTKRFSLNAAKLWNEKQETCRAYYEYIIEGIRLRPAVVLQLLDYHADLITTLEPNQLEYHLLNTPSYAQKVKEFRNGQKYITRRKNGEIAPETPYEQGFGRLYRVAGSYVVDVLTMMDEELLAKGEHFEEQLLQNLGSSNFSTLAYISYSQRPDNVAHPDGFCEPEVTGQWGVDLSVSYHFDLSARPLIFKNSPYALPFPVWLNMKASKKEILADFEALLERHYERCKRIMKMPVDVEGKSGKKTDFLGTVSLDSAMEALRCWRASKIRGIAGGTPYEDVFVGKTGLDLPRKENAYGNEVYDLSEKVKLADDCFKKLEGILL
jgi:hypothetical protein